MGDRIVVDASAWVDYLVSRSWDAIRTRIETADELHTPALCDIEVASAVRRLVRIGLFPIDAAQEVLTTYRDLPLSRHAHTSLLLRILELRDSFSAYDAAYVVLAEQLGASLLTADAGLARAIRQARGLAVAIAE